jgi:hypothetical protein
LNDLPQPAEVDIEANLDVFLAARSATDRYASFDYCFNYFQSHAEQGRIAALAEGPNLEISCLQLGFYLASWGMYRGSTLRLQRSLAYLVPAVDVIATSPREIWTTDADDYSDEACSLIFDVGARLRAAFPEGASETLVTKVMLGVFGCVPAFDFYFKRGSGLSAFNRSALGQLARFYEANAEVIERHMVHTLEFATGSDSARRYSRAKVIDMIFFVEGAKVDTGP